MRSVYSMKEVLIHVSMTLQQVSELLKKTTAGPENSDFNFQFQQPPPVYYTSGGGNPGPPQVQDVVTVTSTGSTTTQPPSSKGRKSSKNNVSNFNMPLL